METTTIVTTESWENFHKDHIAQQQLLDDLTDILLSVRWFGGKGRIIDELKCDHCLKLNYLDQAFFLFIVEVSYQDYEPEYYLLPLALTTTNDLPAKAIFADWQGVDGNGYVIDACYSQAFQQYLFESIAIGKPLTSSVGQLQFDRGKGLPDNELYEFSSTPTLEQSNSSIFYNGRYFMKIYRKLWLETNPEVEMLKFLTEKGHYQNIPAYAGSIIWDRVNTKPVTFALMMQMVDADKDSWAKTGDELNAFLHAFLKGDFSIGESVFDNVELLAKRTAEMHLALSSNDELPDFKPEPYNDEYRAWLFKHLQSLLVGRLAMLETNKHKLDAEALRMGKLFSDNQDRIMAFFELVKTKPIHSLRARIHGDYHLGQCLYTGSDYVVIDFEGEPESSITDRKIKHSPLKDVAGMVRSFHYAVSSKLYFSSETQQMDLQKLYRATDRWFNLIRDTYVDTYLDVIGKDTPLYHNKGEINYLLMLHLMEKAIYELGYELNGRPDWVKIPLKGIEQVINELEKYLE